MNSQNGNAALVAVTPAESAIIESVVVGGDVSRLTPQQRVSYYTMRCEAAGLDPRTQPFAYITLQGKLTLYATKTATEQLCERRGLSMEIVTEGIVPGDLYRVQARVYGKDGRRTDNIGVVTVAGLKAEAMANAMMKAVTKSYRRAVLAHCGMGMLDESEAETIPGATVLPPPVVHEQPESELAADPATELADEALCSEYLALAETADGVGIKTKLLPDNASVALVRKWIAALEAKIEARAIEQGAA